MTSNFTLQFLKDKIGDEYIEENPVTGQPRIIQGLNEVWTTLDEHGGVGQVAKLFGLSEEGVWGWVDSHCIPDMYVKYLVAPGQMISDVQLSSVGFEDPESGLYWPSTWNFDAATMGLAK